MTQYPMCNMSDPFLFSDGVWNLIAVIVNGLIILFLTWLKLDLNANSQKIDNVRTEVKEIHHATNSMKDELVREVKEAAYAAGVKSEVDKLPP